MQIVRTGQWRYGNAVNYPVDIVGLPYDFWFELAKSDDQLDPGETPTTPQADGLLYYVRFTHAGEMTTPTWPDSIAYASVESAMRAAEDQAPTPITWD